MNDKINVIGWPFVKAGMGEHLRKVVSAFETSNIDYGVYDVLGQCFNNLSFFDNTDVACSNKTVDSIGKGFSVFALNLNHLPRIERELFSAKINVGYGYCEHSSLLDPFVKCQASLDEIWAPSAFVQQVLSKKLSIPVVHMPIPLFVNGTRASVRDKFSLPKKSFLYLTTFDARSLIERKNPYAVIQAYKRAFDKIKADVGLVVKLTYSTSDKSQVQQVQELRDLCKDANIYLIAEMLDHSEVLDLINDCNCYVSLHRAEGLGLGMAEAMCLGKPVIATGYSGNMEFMRADNSCLVNYKLIEDLTYNKMIPNYEPKSKLYWADADIDHAAEYMKKIFIDDGFRVSIQKCALEHMKNNYNPTVVGEAYKERINLLLDKARGK
jgi:glycosyltransferase involved in cell wall biosynthesis